MAVLKMRQKRLLAVILALGSLSVLFQNFTSSYPVDLMLTPGQSVVVAPGTAYGVWIGSTVCDPCASQTQKYRIQLNNLVPGEIYSLVLRSTFHTGNKIYKARSLYGTSEFFGEQRKMFFEQGQTQEARNIWKIDFKALGYYDVIELGNDSPAGTYNYLYFDTATLEAKRLKVPDSFMIQVGDADHSGKTVSQNGEKTASSEFKSWENNPTHIVGSNDLSTVRQWFGRSSGPLPTTQTLHLKNLTPGVVYQLTVHFSYFVTTSSLYATMRSGGAYYFNGSSKTIIKSGPARNTEQWIMEFQPSTTEMTVELGAVNVNPNYVYIDYYRLTKRDISLQQFTPAALSQWLYDRDGSSLWYAHNLNNYGSGADYANEQAYIMQSYLDAFKATGDFHWIERLVQHADIVLSQRDSVVKLPDGTVGRADYRGRKNGVWQEVKTKYAWVGFNGAVFKPLVELGRIVAENDGLRSRFLARGDSLFSVSQVYLMEYDKVLAHFAEDWVETDQIAYYRFPMDLGNAVPGAGPLLGNAVAFDMGAMMAINYINLAHYYQIIGTEFNYADQIQRATDSRSRARKYAYFFKLYFKERTISADKKGLYWPFSNYSTREDGSLLVDDINHANWNILFLAHAYRENMSYTLDDMKKVANSYEALILPNGDLGVTLIDGTDYAGFSGASVNYYLQPLACFSSSLVAKTARGINYEASPIHSVMTLANSLSSCR